METQLKMGLCEVGSLLAAGAAALLSAGAGLRVLVLVLEGSELRVQLPPMQTCPNERGSKQGTLKLCPTDTVRVVTSSLLYGVSRGCLHPAGGVRSDVGR